MITVSVMIEAPPRLMPQVMALLHKLEADMDRLPGLVITWNAGDGR